MKKLTVRQKNRMTIVEAAKRLQENGHRLVRVAPFDMDNMTARYRVILDGSCGTEVILTSTEILNLI